MFNYKARKTVSIILLVFVLFTALPEVVANAYATTYRYKYTITWKWKIKKTKKKKSRTKLSRTKVSTTVGEYEYIYLKKARAKKVKWYSSNKKVATVKKKGKWCEIRTKKKGTVTITAKYKGKKYSCKVKVKKKYTWVLKEIYGYSDEWLIDDPILIRDDGDDDWEMWYDDYDIWGYPVFSIKLKKNIYPITLYWEIKDPDILDLECEWDDLDGEWDIWLEPKKEGKTTIIFTNSYNNEEIELNFKITE